MATISDTAAFDDDDGYYDLTAEEEALLCQLDAQISQRPPKATAADSFTESTLFETPRSHVSTTASPGHSSRTYKSSPGRGLAAAGPANANSSVASNGLYPDRKYCPTRYTDQAVSPTY